MPCISKYKVFITCYITNLFHKSIFTIRGKINDEYEI